MKVLLQQNSTLSIKRKIKVNIDFKFIYMIFRITSLKAG